MTLGVGVRALTSEFVVEKEPYRNLFTLHNHINPESLKKVRNDPLEFSFHDPEFRQRVDTVPKPGDIINFVSDYEWDVYQCIAVDPEYVYLKRVAEQHVIKGPY